MRRLAPIATLMNGLVEQTPMAVPLSSGGDALLMRDDCNASITLKPIKKRCRAACLLNTLRAFRGNDGTAVKAAAVKAQRELHGKE